MLRVIVTAALQPGRSLSFFLTHLAPPPLQVTVASVPRQALFLRIRVNLCSMINLQKKSRLTGKNPEDCTQDLSPGFCRGRQLGTLNKRPQHPEKEGPLVTSHERPEAL
ncbi:unnamed protein product [Discosporangium mesarthrocarpum]